MHHSCFITNITISKVMIFIGMVYYREYSWSPVGLVCEHVNATDLPLCSVLSSLVIPLVRKLGNLQKATVCYVTSKYTTLILNPIIITK